MNATDLANGVFAEVKQLCGNSHLISTLESMGIFPGTIILKKSSSILHGPIVIQKGATQLAIGHKFAKNIIVEKLQA